MRSMLMLCLLRCVMLVLTDVSYLVTWLRLLVGRVSCGRVRVFSISSSGARLLWPVVLIG